MDSYLIYRDTILGRRYIDAFDGQQYFWTNDRKTAWRLPDGQAQRRLEQVRKQYPGAQIEKA